MRTIGRIATASGVGVETIRFYEREGLLGEGTFGKVYRCKERATGRVVAVKRLHKSQSSKEGAELPMNEENSFFF